ncbi:uncharacterized protein BDZ99DRAFT_552185 [Mytilinidion resinicola]|uniref:ABM domain-containing protein n=1 Tax=Mytilinidion resinicola TaxID=574789 RepID=A0A6A6XZH4_9PEZI|nr:uncharacterized protein BDZ99DRAFT_552185 [Mytilinidion resinicola]KAF2801922.1 hypothetical protein BDZ99DRAFT_552185 [Mytilinidion resinicola]
MSSTTETPIYVTILYHTSNTRFGMAYYLDHHIPLSKNEWGPYEMTSCVVCDTVKSSEYAVMVIATWRSIESWNKAQEADCTKAIVEDVKNYTDAEAVVLVGSVVGRENHVGTWKLERERRSGAETSGFWIYAIDTNS